MQPPNVRTHARGLLLLLQACATATAVVRRSAHSVAAVSGGAVANGSATIEPRLRPLSDKKFFREDYPYDRSPETPNSFDIVDPYPRIQNSKDYDKDFVSDENTDAGEWKAQNDYDRLRKKYEKDKFDTLAAEDDQSLEKKHMDAAKASEAAAEQISQDAENTTAEAKRHLEEAQHEVDVLIGDSGGRQKGGKIGVAVGDVNHEVKDVEACTRELAMAKAKLKRLQDERNALLQKLSAAEKDAANAKAKAEKRYEELKHTEKLDELDKTSAERQKEYDEALAKYRKSDAEMEHLEADIKGAAVRLREARRTEDANGGIYYRRSAAHRVAGSQAVALVAASWMLLLANVL